VLLQHLLDDGLSKTAIAQRLGVSRRVIYHWLKTGQHARDVDVPVPRQYASRPHAVKTGPRLVRDSGPQATQ
jgi:transposase